MKVRVTLVPILNCGEMAVSNMEEKGKKFTALSSELNTAFVHIISQRRNASIVFQLKNLLPEHEE